MEWFLIYLIGFVITATSLILLERNGKGFNDATYAGGMIFGLSILWPVILPCIMLWGICTLFGKLAGY